MELGKRPQEATNFARQIKAFHNAKEETLWITFHDQSLYWGVIDPDKPTTEAKDGYTMRSIKGEWSNKNLKGEVLRFEKISGAILAVQGYRGTSCSIEDQSTDGLPKKSYLLRLIAGEVLESVQEAVDSLKNLQGGVKALIGLLHPDDFEYFVDLIFQRSGWLKMTPGGGVEKDIDFDLLQPLTNDRAFVQVKSKSNTNEFNKYLNSFNEMKKSGLYKIMFYVVHTDEDKLPTQTQPDVYIVGADRLSELIIELGLASLLIKKVS